MFRAWLSSFWKKNKNGIIDVLKKVFMVILISYSVAFIFSSITINNDENSTSNNTSTVYKPKETVISGDNISEEKYKEHSNIIDEFISYCNEGNIKSAYKILTDECKEKMYPTEEDFIKKYYNIIFDSKKTYNLQSWVTSRNFHTYKIRILDDILATGDYDSSKQYEDYITIVLDNEKEQINIGGFICNEEINKETETKDFIVTVIEKDVYMDYEEYTLEITNNTKNTILLSKIDDARDNIILTDNRGMEYKVDENSINEVKLKVLKGQTKKLKIIFDKECNTDTKGEQIEFLNIIMDYNLYQEEGQYKKYKQLNVLL